MSSRRCVLAVDDSAGVRAVLRAVLGAAGYEVATAASVEEAMGRLHSLQPDVILTDFNMPELNGHDFVRLVRRNPRLAAVPIFVLSSEDGAEKCRLMSGAGAAGWFTKPIDHIRLLAGLQRACPSA
jgi:two-component system chemotaxis response regulator CheY